MSVKVSIIIPAYNTERYIRKCIDSILNQTFQDFEVIIIDDCSSDDTVRIVQSYGDRRIYLYKNEKNSGPSYSRNRAIKFAKGEYIAVLDSDDWWTPNRLEQMISFMKKNNADMVFDNLLYIRENSQTPWQTYYQHKNMIVNEPLQVTPEFFVNYDLGILKAIIRKDVLIKNGIFYNESIKYGEDFLFYLEIIMKTNKVWLLPEGYYYYLTREGSLVTNMYALAKQCIQSTDDFIAESGKEITPELRSSLEKRRQQFFIIAKYHETDKFLKEKRYGKAIKNLAMYPKILGMVVTIRLRLLKNGLIKK
jgi:succinoglycan biosynthesis protein ExoO